MIIQRNWKKLHEDVLRLCLLICPLCMGWDFFEITREEQMIVLVNVNLLGFMAGFLLGVKEYLLSFFMLFASCLQSLRG